MWVVIYIMIYYLQIELHLIILYIFLKIYIPIKGDFIDISFLKTKNIYYHFTYFLNLT